jgi:hypothetical protein
LAVAGCEAAQWPFNLGTNKWWLAACGKQGKWTGKKRQQQGEADRAKHAKYEANAESRELVGALAISTGKHCLIYLE